MTSGPLFAGQTTHPLSEAEKQAFFEKIDLSGRLLSFGDEKKMRNALEFIIQTPSGAEQAREIIESSKTQYDVNISRFVNLFLPSNSAVSVPIINSVFLRSEYLDKPRDVAKGILHEILHQRQPSTLKTHPVLAEAETMALTSHMEMELFPESTSLIHRGYKKIYDANYKEALKVAKGEKTPPKGYPPFKSLTKGNEEDAQKAYAAQLARKKTMAQFIKGFLSPETLDEEAISFGRQIQRESYLQQANDENRLEITPAVKEDLIKRYAPFITSNDFNSIESEHANAEAIKKLEKIKTVPLSAEDEKISKEIEDLVQHPQKIQKNKELRGKLRKEPGMEEILIKLKQKKPLKIDEKRFLKCMLIKNSNLSTAGKLQEMKLQIQFMRYPGSKACNLMLLQYERLNDRINNPQKNVQGELQEAPYLGPGKEHEANERPVIVDGKLVSTLRKGENNSRNNNNLPTQKYLGSSR